MHADHCSGSIGVIDDDVLLCELDGSRAVARDDQFDAGRRHFDKDAFGHLYNYGLYSYGQFIACPTHLGAAWLELEHESRIVLF